MRLLKALAFALYKYGRMFARIGVGLDMRAIGEIHSVVNTMVQRGWLTEEEASEILRIIRAADKKIKEEFLLIEDAIEEVS